VWWSWRHVVDQFAARLSETWRTALLMSADRAERHFFWTPFSHYERRWPVFWSKRQDAEVHGAAQSPAQWSLQLKTWVPWWPTKCWSFHLHVSQYIDKSVTTLLGVCDHNVIQYEIYMSPITASRYCSGADFIFLAPYCGTRGHKYKISKKTYSTVHVLHLLFPVSMSKSLKVCRHFRHAHV